MNANAVLLRNDIVNENLGNESILLSDDGTMFTLNQTAKFIWENCDRKSAKDLAKQLYDACINKNELSFTEIQNDCIEVIETMMQQGFIKYIK